MRKLPRIILIILAAILLLMSLQLLFPLGAPTTPARWAVKIFISAPSPFLFLARC
jgi:hypothetical protein